MQARMHRENLKYILYTLTSCFVTSFWEVVFCAQNINEKEDPVLDALLKEIQYAICNHLITLFASDAMQLKIITVLGKFRFFL